MEVLIGKSPKLNILSNTFSFMELTVKRHSFDLLTNYEIGLTYYGVSWILFQEEFLIFLVSCS